MILRLDLTLTPEPDGHGVNARTARIILRTLVSESLSDDIALRDEAIEQLVFRRVNDLIATVAGDPGWWHKAYPELPQ